MVEFLRARMAPPLLCAVRVLPVFARLSPTVSTRPLLQSRGGGRLFVNHILVFRIT